MSEKWVSLTYKERLTDSKLMVRFYTVHDIKRYINSLKCYMIWGSGFPTN